MQSTFLNTETFCGVTILTFVTLQTLDKQKASRTCVTFSLKFYILHHIFVALTRSPLNFTTQIFMAAAFCVQA